MRNVSVGRTGGTGSVSEGGSRARGGLGRTDRESPPERGVRTNESLIAPVPVFAINDSLGTGVVLPTGLREPTVSDPGPVTREPV